MVISHSSVTWVLFLSYYYHPGDLPSNHSILKVTWTGVYIGQFYKTSLHFLETVFDRLILLELEW